jgi:hypothetical protein
MKPIQIVIGFLAGVIVAYCAFDLRQAPFQFIASQDGQILWRCNRITGEVISKTSLIPTKEDANLELWKGEYHDFVFNKKTGQIWRYFKNDTNSIPDEGFAPLDYGNPQAVLHSTNPN